MLRTTLHRRLALLAAGGLLAASAASASAMPAGGGGGTAPAPVPASEFRLVIKDIAILDAAGATLKDWHCEWTEPQEDDQPCLRFSGDPQAAYKAIKEAGGESATIHTVIPDLESDLLTTIRERGDGTWLFRTAGTMEGESHYAGYVCSADGRTCSSWRANSRRGSQRAIKAASARMKKKARARTR